MIEPPPCFSMIRDHVLHCQKAALEVYGEHSVPLLFRQFHDAADMGEADVVIDDIEPSINIHACLDQCDECRRGWSRQRGWYWPYRCPDG